MNNEARQEILNSIRTHLAASAPFDGQEQEQRTGAGIQVTREQSENPDRIALFKQNLEAVDGHCIIARSKGEIAGALTQIISALQKTKLRAQRIAISEASELELEELGIAPNASDIFGFDVGISTAQAAIAETGTLVLDSARERHRLVSLVPPVHIAIVDASTIRATLGETLTMLQSGKELSPAVTFITGPSRTADIELTLTIGVHGPQELYVIINQPT
jgi:L-lactate dehydrogenase complex protein LldG